MAIALDVTGHASAVRVTGGTLVDKEVQDCLVETLEQFAYPRLREPGEIKYQFDFRPAE